MNRFQVVMDLDVLIERLSQPGGCNCYICLPDKLRPAFMGSTERECQDQYEEMKRRMLARQNPPAEPTPPAQPVDRSQRELISGNKEADRPDYRELKPSGQQKDYVVLSDEERAKGFVRPVRSAYVHKTCGTTTSMNRKLAETYARDPKFYSGTFCGGCGAHFPVGPEGEFVWVGTTEKVGT